MEYFGPRRVSRGGLGKEEEEIRVRVRARVRFLTERSKGSATCVTLRPSEKYHRRPACVLE
jgi:hypothetical protein